jgi:hypothetical protein
MQKTSIVETILMTRPIIRPIYAMLYNREAVPDDIDIGAPSWFFILTIIIVVVTGVLGISLSIYYIYRGG